MKKVYKNYLGRNFKKIRTSDKLNKKARSSQMSKIRSSDTEFERGFIVELKKRTRSKFETCVSSIRGKPDIVFKNKKVCIFLDSDFWHGWQYSRWRHLLKDDFWRKKIQNNRNRDKKTTLYLKNRGWIVLRIWEHKIKENSEKCLNKIVQSLKVL